jgi:ATP-binding cassette subfamily B protein
MSEYLFDKYYQCLQIIEPEIGEIIWEDRGNLASLHIVLEGKIRLLDREENLLISLGKNTVFGQSSLFATANFQPYKVRASTGLKLGYLSTQNLKVLLEQQPELKAELYRQAVELDLIVLHSCDNPQSDCIQYLYSIVSLLEQHQLELGSIDPTFWESLQLVILRRGKISHSSGLTLTPGKIYDVAQLPVDQNWLIKEATELYTLESSTLATRPQPQQLVVAQPLPQENATIQPQNTSDRLIDQAYFPSPSVKIANWWQHLTKRYPFYKQFNVSDCGVACLMIIGRYWGKEFNFNELRAIANVDRSGVSIRGLISAAEYLGFAPRPVQTDLIGLEKQELPAIAHWEGDHYIVVFRIIKDKVIVVDPQIGQRNLTRQEFVKGWTGYTLLLQPTAKFKSAPEAKPNIWKYLELLKPYWLVLLEILVASLTIQIVGLLLPIFTQLLLDRVVIQGSISTLIAIGAGMLIFEWSQIALSGVRRYLLFHTANKLDLSLIVGFISHTFKLPLSYFETRYVGDITSRIDENRKIRSFITGEAITTVLDLASIFIYIFLMLWYDWKLSLLALTIVPIFSFVTIVYTPLLIKVSREYFEALTRENRYLIEALTGVSTIKSMGVERTVRWRWEELINEEVKIDFSSQMLQERIEIAIEFADKTISCFVLLFGVWQVIHQQLTLGQLIALNMLAGYVIAPFKRSIYLWNEFQEVRIAVERLDDVINAPPEENAASSSIVLPPIQGNIRFDRVSFRYHLENKTNVLENLTFEISPGQTVALVGRSGSGKTTIAKLLLGLYTPTEGKIFIDGYELNTIAKQSLRRQTGIVDQDTFLFGGTVLENLTIACPNATQAEIEAACRLAGAEEFIEDFPLKYQTQIGEGGGQLSGGQRQRLAIARALLGKPRLLILDEATSSLDVESERIIQNNLNAILQHQTTFVIAHRLSTVRNADLILVLDKGILVESGTHEELMARSGQYYYLNQQQLYS